MIKAVITNTTRQHANIHYWRATKGDIKMDFFTVPMGVSKEVEIPALPENNQLEAVGEQCRVLGLSFREGTL